jgi:outer membrane protein TolC
LFEHQTVELQVQFELEKAIIAAWSSTKKQSLIQAQAIAAPIQFDAAKNEYASGLSEVVQLSTAQAQYTENGVQIKRYADEYNSAYSDLYRATETDEQFQIDDKRIEQWIDASLKTIESRALGDYVAYALAYRPELQTLDTQKEGLELDASKERSSYLPKLKFTAELTNNTFLSVFTESLETQPTMSPTFWQIGLRVLWEFDSFGHAFTAEQYAALALEKFFKRLDEVEKVKNEVEIEYFAAQAAIKTIAEKEEIYQREMAAGAMKRAAYEAGLATIVEYNDAMVNVEEAHYDLITQKSNAVTAVRTLFYRCGYFDQTGDTNVQ